jgi:uncharacterized membrane protein YdjX (TVP38/TMEM64 family)
MPDLFGNIWGMVALVASVFGGIIAIFWRGWLAARERAERKRLEERVRGAEARANEERHVDRSDDPSGELRRDWRRGL